VKGELAPRRLPIVPGHQIVADVLEVGGAVSGVAPGDRVGVPWLGWACGNCPACRAGRENLCPSARFTGWDLDGGYAEEALADAAFVHKLPARFPDELAAPLLCAGAIGWRAYRLSEAQPGARVGLFGFGASAHLVLQIARHFENEVYAFSRTAAHREQALRLGARWAGAAGDEVPALLDAAILFAPAGGLVLPALEALAPGGTLAIASIHLTPIPALDYARHLYREKTVRSVANSTRADVASLLELAATIPLAPEVELAPLAEAGAVLERLERSQVSGAAVLEMGARR
jgi:propanol-preferring alcohol dehydrogenase